MLHHLQLNFITAAIKFYATRLALTPEADTLHAAEEPCVGSFPDYGEGCANACNPHHRSNLRESNRDMIFSLSVTVSMPLRRQVQDDESIHAPLGESMLTEIFISSSLIGKSGVRTSLASRKNLITEVREPSKKFNKPYLQQVWS